ncbi:hypothetical protein QQS21_002695 [Conoideocrella luteorostrata]|uniref:Xylanolytic transcriptional activator regulatory domain-containing protein n=1 Tax=Conoideocrella luteorostrata TaxID=1105319 RepID=A0AAJ0G2R2_9HYPO|nr:hypothetical protein QQS21_002695 [Conoideocrella luteorostrata]
MIDEAEFWEIFESNEDDSSAKIPLMLFQAILFASVPYVKMPILLQCGFADKRTALHAFYNRAKLLFESKMEDRPRYLAQTAFLFSSYTTCADPQAANSWLSRAIELLLTAKDDFDDPDRRTNKGKEQPSWKRRLWLSIIIRDRIICLGLRRRPQVMRNELNLAGEPLQEDDLMNENRNSRVYNTSTKRTLARVFQEQCRLAVLLTDMVSMLFTSESLQDATISSTDLSTKFSTVSSTKKALSQWIALSMLPSILDDTTCRAVKRMVKTSFMYYHTACMGLAHYESMLLVKNASFAGPLYNHKLRDTGNTLRSSMIKLIEIMEYFSRDWECQRGHTISMLAFLEMPMIITAIDLKLSPSASETEIRRQRMEAMGKLFNACGQSYVLADTMGSCTNQLLRLAYDFTRRLFLHNDRQQSSMDPSSRGQSLVPSRARNWGDAFLRFPHAYLMISTSVDYYLRVGKLPSSDCLPEFVQRSTLPMGLTLAYELEPPWSAELIHSNAGSSNQALQNADSRDSNFLKLPSSLICPIENGNQEGDAYTYDQALTPMNAAVVASSEPHVAVPKRPRTNLDFFSFDSACEGRSQTRDLGRDSVSPDVLTCSLSNAPAELDENDLWSFILRAA